MKRLYLRGIAATAMVAATLALGPAVPALAEGLNDGLDSASITPCNTIDTTYNFSFGANETDGTAWRGKDGTTSTYIRIDWKTGNSPRLYVDGAYNSDGYGSTNCTIEGYVRAPGPDEYEIHNLVYESGFRWARLTCWADLGSGAMAGAWSPDCGGDYTDLN